MLRTALGVRYRGDVQNRDPVSHLSQWLPLSTPLPTFCHSPWVRDLSCKITRPGTLRHLCAGFGSHLQLGQDGALPREQGTVLAQRAVEAKSNEIPALRELLAPLSIEGRVVTADALHTQRETARFLVEEKGAHYLFTVKDNQKTLANDLKAFDWESIPP